MEVLSEFYKTYNKPSTVKVADKKFKQIISLDTKDYISASNERESVAHMFSVDSFYTSYAKNNKVYRFDKEYYQPVSRVIGGKLYNNIVKKVVIPGKYETYKIEKLYGENNEVKVTKSGVVIDKKEVLLKLRKRKFLALLKKLKNMFF